MKRIVQNASFLIGLWVYICFVAFVFSMVTGTIWFQSEGQETDLNKMFFAGTVGVAIASPLLLFVILPWFYRARDNVSFFNWVVLPTIFTTLYSLIFLLYLFGFKDSRINFVLLFPSTGFLSSFFIWLTFKNSFFKNLIPTTNETNVIENAYN